ncbi:unannotated protein [freshwater metagenome]|uniref:Unannotated protein n=1 Tax=freshwater metagenome TaxID=449393 RepID=A0A6J6PBU4_9ZZZZ
MVLSHATDHLGNEHGFADAGTTEETDLSTGHVWGEQVDDFDACFEQALRWLERIEVWGWTVDVPALDIGEICIVAVEHLAPHVPDVAQGAVTDGHVDATAGVAHWCATGKAVGWLEANGANATVTELLSNFGEHGNGLAVDVDGELDGMVQLGQRASRELNVDHRAGNADNATVFAICFSHGHGCWFLVLSWLVCSEVVRVVCACGGHKCVR